MAWRTAWARTLFRSTKTLVLDSWSDESWCRCRTRDGCNGSGLLVVFGRFGVESMSLRTISTFTTTIPDDTQWSDDGEISVPGGKAIANIVSQFLRASGTSCGDPALRDSYGWELQAEFERQRFLIVVQLVDDWILQCEPVSKLHVEPTSTMLRLLAKCMASDERFGNVRWYFSTDFEKGDLSKASDQPC
jgi:hypothetical protein